MKLDSSRKGAPVLDPTRPKADQVEELRQAVAACYCGLGPACPIWLGMSPAERTACSSDKRASAQLLWKHGVTH